MSGKLLTEIDGCELALDDFKAAPNSYIDELEDKAISRLAYQGLSKPALEELESSKDVFRSYLTNWLILSSSHTGMRIRPWRPVDIGCCSI
jgi:hypothetical protein